mmetsp:Transcript_9471/g.17798  ORF Transcript_9471/g.17798 Transcript_9471/m.17798 type:complete len:90 (-) Transcript_9471:353-622(-)
MSFQYKLMTTVTRFADIQTHSLFDTSVFGVQHFWTSCIPPVPHILSWHELLLCCGLAVGEGNARIFIFTVIQSPLVRGSVGEEDLQFEI